MLAPRVVIAMPDQWPRALLRAALREIGYDAIGTRSLARASASVAPDIDRGPVRVIVVDIGAVATAEPGEIADFCAGRGVVPVLLLASAVTDTPSGCWTRILRRPFSVDDAVRVVTSLAPLPPTRQEYVDAPPPASP
jgi:hypothetical protein